MMAEAAVFDIAVTVGGSNVPRFSDINITRAAGGLGTSGVVTTELTFTIPACDIDLISAYRAAPVEIGYAAYDGDGNRTGISDIGLPTMYISGRSKSKGVITFTCRDSMAFLGMQIPCDKFTDAKRRGYMQLSSLLEYLIHNEDVDFTSSGGYTDLKIPFSLIEGKSYSELLQAVSNVLLGVWWESSDRSLQFTPFGLSSGYVVPTDCTSIDEGCDYRPTALVARDSSGKEYRRGNGFHTYDTLQIDSELVTEELVSQIDDRLKISAGSSPTFYGVVCDRRKITQIPPVICTAKFEETGSREWGVNNIRATVTPSGIYATLAFNAPSYDEIGSQGVLTKAIQNKVSYGEHGKWVFDKYKGLRVFVPSNAASDGSETQ